MLRALRTDRLRRASHDNDHPFPPPRPFLFENDSPVLDPVPVVPSMAGSTCRFCAHANPKGARFCNECGSQIDLMPCARCDAVNRADASVCHECGTVLAIPREPPPAVFESTDSDAAIATNASAEEPAASPPVATAPALAQRRQTDRRGDVGERAKPRRAQAAGLLALGFAIASGAYWAHRPLLAPDDSSVQRGVPTTTTLPTRTSVEPATVASESAPADSAASLDDAPIEHPPPQASTEEAPTETFSQPAATVDVAPPTRSVTSTAEAGAPKTATRRASEAPSPAPSFPPRASSPGERACTEAVAALGLCDSPERR
jgi:hypothetical protein